eukprot:1148151-Pelagomonas_calceolata.AAC.8
MGLALANLACLSQLASHKGLSALRIARGVRGRMGGNADPAARMRREIHPLLSSSTTILCKPHTQAMTVSLPFQLALPLAGTLRVPCEYACEASSAGFTPWMRSGHA